MHTDLEKLGDMVRQAGAEELLPRFQRVSHEVKADGSLLTEADLAVDRRLRESLHRHWPDIGFLSEEMDTVQQETLLTRGDQRLWCLDPLDGTSNFAAGLPFFGISLALITEGKQELGVVYDPARDELFLAESGGGAWLNGERLRCPERRTPLAQTVALVDFKRLSPDLVNRLTTEPPYHSQRNLGACVLEWAWMAAGRGHLYLHGGQKLWDQAAGSLILAEAGGFSETLEGEPAFRATMQPRSIVAAPEADLFEAWRTWIKDA